MIAHMRLKMVRPEHFMRWLALFGETADALTPPAIAAQFRARSELIARSLQMGMFFRPEAAKETSS
jgi:hemoglobin